MDRIRDKIIDQRLTRRSFVKTCALGAGAMALPFSACTSGLRKPDFTAAFLTDMHVMAEANATEGFISSIQHTMNLRPRPDFLITGGDMVMDILSENKEEADRLYELFDHGVRESQVPIHHTLGNHDCLGVYDDSGVPSDHPLFGKSYFLDRFDRESTYYSFDHKGWHFVIMDSVGIVDRDYRGWVDAEQIAWLDEDLRTANCPTVISMHIPLLTNMQEMREGTAEPNHPKLSVGNCHEVIEVLEKHPVKLVIAGHLHINESYRYKEMEFANIGAVSGRWWQGDRYGFEEGYALLEFRGEEVCWRYMDYGWDVVPEEEVTAEG